MAVLPVGVSVALEPGTAVSLRGTRRSTSCSKWVTEKDLFLARMTVKRYHKHGVSERPASFTLTSFPCREVPRPHGNPVGSVELELHHKTEGLREGVASANPLFDHSGNVRGAVGALIDITERKRVESQLQEQRGALPFRDNRIANRVLVLRSDRSTSLSGTKQ